MSVTGLDEVMRNLNREIRQIEGVTLAGLLDAGLQVQAVAQSRTPVRTGNLKGSAYTLKQGPLSVAVGYGAAYAVYVHENVTAHFKNGQAKFLESALNDNRAEIVEIIRRRAKM